MVSYKTHNLVYVGSTPTSAITGITKQKMDLYQLSLEHGDGLEVRESYTF